MRHLRTFIIIAASISLVILSATVPIHDATVFAQSPGFVDQLCPSGTSAAFGGGGQEYNNTNGKFVQNICVDIFGRLSAVFNSDPDTGISLYAGDPINLLSTLGASNFVNVGNKVNFVGFNIGTEATATVAVVLEDSITSPNVSTQFNTLSLAGTGSRTGISSPYYSQILLQGSNSPNFTANYYSEDVTASSAPGYTGTISNDVGFYADGSLPGTAFAGTITNKFGHYCPSVFQSFSPALTKVCMQVDDLGTGANVFAFRSLGLTPSSFGGKVTVGSIATQSNCSSSTGSCGSASAGAVTIAAAATTVTVSTTAVTANSDIAITENSANGTRLGVTCNTTTGRTYSVTTVTAGTSFVITASAAPATNPACLNFHFVN